MIGILLFHLGIIPVFLSHVSGLGIPKSWIQAFGISDELYHFGAVWGGGFFGVVTFIGMFILTFRRFSTKRVRNLSSSSDLIVNCLLLSIVFSGVYSSLVTNNVDVGFDYRDSISACFRSLFTSQPDVGLMSEVPVAFKLHIIAGFLIFAMWPFTRLVHAWSVPVHYAGRSYILYRRPEQTNRKAN